MPPASKHLQWLDFTTFGGLWTAGASSLMPANRAQIMSGCHPQPGGGLRAFLKPAQTVAGTGLVSTYLNLPGAAADYAETPTSGSYSPSDSDLTLQMLVALTDWTPASTQILFSNRNLAAFTGWELRVNTDGTLAIAWGTGAALKAVTSTVATGIADGTAKWIRVTLDADNGAAGHTVKFYTSTDAYTWTQLGATVTTAGVTTVGFSNEVLRIGSRPDGTSPMVGKVWKAYMADFPASSTGFLVTSGTDFVQAGPDFRSGLGATTVVDNEAGGGGVAVWTLNGAASIVTDGTPNVPIGFGVSPRASEVGGSLVYPGPTGSTLLVATVEAEVSPLADLRVWHRDLHDSAATRWLHVQNSIFSWAPSIDTTPEAGQPAFVRMDDSGVAKDLVAIPFPQTGLTAQSTEGVYTFSGGTWTVSRNVTATDAGEQRASHSLVEHQSRLVVGYRDKILFTAADALSFSAAGSGFLTLNPEGWLMSGGAVRPGPLIAWMVSVPPGDLIVATRDGRIYNVQGDLADPTVRELGRWTTMMQHEPARTPNGVFFILPNLGVAALGLDGSAEVVSKDILPAVWNPVTPKVGLGQLAGTERYLFCPNQHAATEHKNGALVFDTETGAWFTSTHADDYTITNPRFMQADNNPEDSGIWVLNSIAPETHGTSNPFAFQFRTGGSESASVATEVRAATYEYKTAPLREPEGRYLDLREVQIPCYAFNTTTSTIAVTVGGTTVTKTLPLGRSVQRFVFRKRGSELDVTVKAKSNDTAIEAPMIESLRVGWIPGPPLR